MKTTKKKMDDGGSSHAYVLVYVKMFFLIFFHQICMFTFYKSWSCTVCCGL